MRNLRTIQTPAIRADRRFDILVKKEMQEQEHLISSHNKEMQSLRDQIKLVLERCTSLSEKSDKDMTDLKVKEKVADQALIIADQKKAIEALHEKLNSFHESQASKDDLDNFKKDISRNVSESTLSHLVAFQNCQREFKELFNGLKEDLLKMSTALRQNILDGTEDAAQKFSQAQLDKEGIERELLRYKKSMFYIEKKIENIYTLIERLNKRGELCHKPE
jgi:hypothetical protein